MISRKKYDYVEIYNFEKLEKEVDEDNSFNLCNGYCCDGRPEDIFKYDTKLSIPMLKLRCYRYSDNNDIYISYRDDIYCISAEGNSLLMYAIYYKNDFIFDCMMKFTQDFDHRNNDNENALFIAAKHRKKKYIKQLLDTECEYDVISYDTDKSLLMYIVLLNFDPEELYEIVKKIIINANIDINYETSKGESVLSYLIQRNDFPKYYKTIEFLISKESNIYNCYDSIFRKLENIQDLFNWGRNAIDLTSETEELLQQQKEIQELFIKTHKQNLKKVLIYVIDNFDLFDVQILNLVLEFL